MHQVAGCWRNLAAPGRVGSVNPHTLQSLTMRILLLAGLCLSPLVSTPVLAQVQQNNPNAANQSMEYNSQMRSLRQEQTTQGNTLQMNIERNQAATPSPNTGPNAIAPIGGGTGVGVGR